jgi:protein arginine N-methyltransferase 1
MAFRGTLSHRLMLADKVRMTSYQRAIHETVKEGDVVADIGTGSGILAFFALQAGAGRVYAIERSEIIREAAKLAKVNGLDERMVFVRGSSSQIEIPEQVDVIVSEIFGNFGLEENVLGFMTEARKRMLKQGGRLIPSWLELYLAPVEAETVWNNLLGFWGGGLYGMDFSPVAVDAISMRHVIDCSSASFLADSAMISRFSLYEIEDATEVFEFKTEFTIEKEGVLHGLVGYFKAGLSQDVVLSTAPDAPLTHWMQVFLPVKGLVKVEKGDVVSCTVKIKRGSFWYWKAVVHRDGVEVDRSGQVDLAISFHKEVWDLVSEDFTPRLSETGEVYREVLGLCDGSATIGEITEALCAKFPAKYRGTREASGVVVSILRGKVQHKAVSTA